MRAAGALGGNCQGVHDRRRGIFAQARDHRRKGAASGIELVAQRARIFIRAFGIAARLGQNHRFGFDRRQRGGRIGPIGLDNRKRARTTQGLDDISRRAVGNNDKRTLQRHGGCGLFRCSPQHAKVLLTPRQFDRRLKALLAWPTAGSAASRCRHISGILFAAVAEGGDNDRVDADGVERRLLRIAVGGALELCTRFGTGHACRKSLRAVRSSTAASRHVKSELRAAGPIEMRGTGYRR